MDQKQGNRYDTDRKFGSDPNRRSRGNHNRNIGGGSTRFTGINQDELKGIVISDESQTPTSQQYDALYEALIVYGSTRNPYVKTALRRMKPISSAELSPAKPNPSEYTTTIMVDGQEVPTEDENLREAIYSVWTEEKKLANKTFRKYNEELSKMFGAIIGQLNTGIYGHVQASPLWEKADDTNDTLTLLRILREVCYRDNNAKVSPAIDLANKMTKFLTSKQDPNKSPAKYVEEVKIRFDVLKSAGGSVISKQLITYTLGKIFPNKNIDYTQYREMDVTDPVKSAEKAEIQKAAENLFVAAVIIKNCNAKTHRNLAQYLADQFAMGNDWYPNNPTAAQDLLNQYRVKKGQSSNHTGNGKEKSKQHNDKASRDSKESSATTFVNRGEPTDKDKPQSEDKVEHAKQLLLKGIEEDDFGDHELCFALVATQVEETPPDAQEDILEDGPEPPESRCSTAKICNQPVPCEGNGNAEKRRSGNFPINTIGAITGSAWAPNGDHQRSNSSELWSQIEDLRRQSIRESPRDYFIFAQPESKVNQNWILLDSQSTCNVVCNPRLLKDIRKHPEDKRIIMHCNSGSVTVDRVGTLKGFGLVWYYPEGIANILSLAMVSDRFRVTFDTELSQTFYVHKLDGSIRKFKRMPCGLYACDLSESTEMAFAITTVKGQEQFYSDLDIKRAKRARKLQETIGFPSTKAFLKMIDNNMILNCPITRRDVAMAEDIYGVNANMVKGKAVRRQPGHVREDVISVPPEILANYQNVTLSIDIYHVNGIKFFRSISRHLKFRTTRAIRDAKDGTILSCIEAINGVYQSRGFRIVQIFGDNEFERLSDRLRDQRNIEFHSVARGAHEPFVERDNRTSKERVRCMFASLPFKRLPRRMTIEMVNAADYWLNCWCSSGGVSDTKSPREIMTGVRLDANKHARFQFGDYVLAHNESDNTVKPRASDAIYLRPTGSMSGGFYVFDLTTARRVHRQTATLAHMTETIIQRVEAIAKEQQAPIGLTFGDYHNQSTILDIDEKDEMEDDDASDATFQPDDKSVDTALTGVESETDGEPSNPDDESISNTPPPNIASTGPEDDGVLEDMPDLIEREDAGDDEVNEPDDEAADNASVASNGIEENDNTMEASDQPPDDAGGNDDEAPHEVREEPEESEIPRRTGLRPSVTRGHNKFTVSEGFESSVHHRNFFTAGFSRAINKLEIEHEAVVLVSAAIDQYNNMQSSMVTPQYGVQKGLKIFGDAGVKAVLKELQQLHDRQVISPCDPAKLSREDVKRALPYLMFLKRKRCGTVKGRGCADGRSQREFISRDEASSPTVSLYALFLSCVIDAIEERDVATADIPGAFLQTLMPEGETVHIRLDGAMAKLLVDIDPERYGPYVVTTRKGKKILYTKANKAIYGTLKAALLFWENLSGKLQEWGFTVNPYDKCTVNKMINGKQCTIQWHVDDLKISHVDEKVVTNVLDKLSAEYGQISPLSITRGKVHEYLGMTIDFSQKGKVKFSMFDYLEDIIANLPDELRTNRNTTSPAPEHLFDVNDESNKLGKKQGDMFHHYVAKLLFAAKRARPDIQTSIAFLCTRVQQPDEDDWKKLIRVLGYIKETIFLPLSLGWDGTGNLYWYVDASFAVHHNMRSHTGGVLTMGDGAIMSISTKQKLNTKSSTEAELVGVDDTIPFNMWTYHFLQWQGREANNIEQGPNPSHTDGVQYIGHSNILYQDNTSSIKLETNGKASSTKRTRHINIRYFLITDKVRRGEVNVNYCPTEEMIADYFTKPLQGAQFRKFRNAIMGLTEADFIAYKIKHEEARRNTPNG